MLLMLEKGIRANSKYMKDYDKNKESSNLQYWNVSDLHG